MLSKSESAPVLSGLVPGCGVVATGSSVPNASEPIWGGKSPVDRHAPRQALDLAVQSMLRESPGHDASRLVVSKVERIKWH
jgi:hypothetical protein